MGDFIEMLEYCCLNRTIFITDAGRFRMCPGLVKSGDILAGLFRINFPFILRSVDSHFKMANVAHIGGLQWGHEFPEPVIKEYLYQKAGFGDLRSDKCVTLTLAMINWPPDVEPRATVREIGIANEILQSTLHLHT